MFRIFQAYRGKSRVRFTRFEQRWNEGQTFRRASGNRCLHDAGKSRPLRKAAAAAAAAAAILLQYTRERNPFARRKRSFERTKVGLQFLDARRAENISLKPSSPSMSGSTPWWMWKRRGEISYFLYWEEKSRINLEEHWSFDTTKSAGDGTDEEKHKETEIAILVVLRTTLASVQRDTNNNSGID